MDIFTMVKAAVTVRQAAEHYGLQVRRNGMTCCPFHNDRHPSLYVSDDHYHCFACGEHGDVIDLTAKLFDIRLYDAARKLASDFHLAPDKPLPESIRQKWKQKTKAQQLRENEQLCFSVLNEYRRLLLDWKKRYAPQAPEDALDKRFVEACHRLPWVEFQRDILLQGDSYERGEIVGELTENGYIRKLQARLREERYHEQPCMDQ
ncbi:CHC2 zinc finger domain-containing protein [Enterocloster sp. 210928-DFI.2.20]|uniref:CHC2 zinc finger domain-containing protein n=1 Tax=Enterocloster TaxID=2719313 RepID=UPI001D090DB8|nr:MULTISPECIES: CHC2 zinc finger domain-containing protein [Enterocloster]MCB7093553.1 CHC2 zinc finger domain-containing protein [Enterocloster sp. 210928-DFI.2.20]MCB7353038.1 CHC2 zinc finger domain-containing protein [Enterocloster bolteae]